MVGCHCVPLGWNTAGTHADTNCQTRVHQTQTINHRCAKRTIFIMGRSYNISIYLPDPPTLLLRLYQHSVVASDAAIGVHSSTPEQHVCGLVLFALAVLHIRTQSAHTHTRRNDGRGANDNVSSRFRFAGRIQTVSLVRPLTASIGGA